MKRPSDKSDDDKPIDSGGSYSHQYDRPKKKQSSPPKPTHSEDDSAIEGKDFYVEDEPKPKRKTKPTRVARPVGKRKKVSQPVSDDFGDRYFWHIVGIVLLVVGSFAVYMIVVKSGEATIRQEAEEKFGPLIAEYCKPPVSVFPQGPRPAVKGKLMIVDIQEQKIDIVYGRCEEYLRAKTPEEVGTIVQLKWEERVVGSYSDGSAAKQWICTLQCIDNATKIGHTPKEFIGSPPPKSIRGGGGASGGKPYKQINEYLESVVGKQK